jgi:putative MFS transporter
MWLIWFTDGFASSIVAFAVMSMFFYGAAAVKFAFVAEVFPTRLRATGLAFSSSLAVTLGTATGPVLVLTAVERLGWNQAFSLFVAVPLVLAGLFYLLLEPLPSGLEVEEVERRLAGERP